jgi:hypothetical protein
MAEEDREPAAGAHGEPAGANGTQPGSQSELLGEMEALRRQARRARHAYWFPLVLLGLLTCASVPFYILPTQQVPVGSGTLTVVSGSGTSGPWLPFLGGMPDPTQGYLAYYWIAALPGALLLTQLWYWWHARRIGLQTPARGYLITTATVGVLATVIPLLSQVRSPHWLRFLGRLNVLWPGDLVIRGTFPFFIMALGLFALAWAERSRALAVTAVIYTGAALLADLYDVSNLTSRLGWTPAPGDQALPNVLLPALVLLVAGAGAFAVQQRHRAAG